MAIRHFQTAIYRQTGCAALSQMNKNKETWRVSRRLKGLVSLQPLVWRYRPFDSWWHTPSDLIEFNVSPGTISTSQSGVIASNCCVPAVNSVSCYCISASAEEAEVPAGGWGDFLRLAASKRGLLRVITRRPQWPLKIGSSVVHTENIPPPLLFVCASQCLCELSIM